MGPTWVLSAPGGPHVGPMNLVIRVEYPMTHTHILVLLCFVVIIALLLSGTCYVSTHHIHGFVQKRHNFFANALESLFSCTKPSNYDHSPSANGLTLKDKQNQS